MLYRVTRVVHNNYIVEWEIIFNIVMLMLVDPLDYDVLRTSLVCPLNKKVVF